MLDTEIKGAASLVAAGAGTTVAWLETVNLIVQIGAGVTAMIASGFAIYYYIKKGRPQK